MSMRSFREDPTAVFSKRPRRGRLLCLALILYTFTTTLVLFGVILLAQIQINRLPMILLYISPFSGHLIGILWMQVLNPPADPFPVLNGYFVAAIILLALQLIGWLLCKAGKKAGKWMIRISVYVQLLTLALIWIAVIFVSGPNLDLYLCLAAAVLIPVNILKGLSMWQSEQI